MLYCSTLVCDSVDEGKIPGQGYCLWSLHGLPRNPKDVHIWLIGVSSDHVCVCECTLQWNGVLSRVGSHLVHPELLG